MKDKLLNLLMEMNDLMSKNKPLVVTDEILEIIRSLITACDEYEKVKDELTATKEILSFYGTRDNFLLNEFGNGFHASFVMADGGAKARKQIKLIDKLLMGEREQTVRK